MIEDRYSTSLFYTCLYNVEFEIMLCIVCIFAGGDSKTLMIVQISPVEKNVGETVASLNFAQRVRSVELGQATKKVESAEIIELKGKLASYEVCI